jgi:hypothetical protein
MVPGLGKLISWENNLSYYEQKSVTVTFSTKLEELERQLPDVSNLSKVLSFFDLESIPLSMIIKGAEGMQHPSTSDSCTSDVSSKKIKQWQSMLHKFKTKWNQQNG